MLSTFPVSGRPAIELDGLRVLVVDDEESVRLGLTLLLAPLGARIESAPSIAAAMPMLETHRPEVVLLDLRLPDAQGLSGLDAVCGKRPEARVVMMTAYGTIETAVEALKRGALDFLTKPVAPEHLFHVLGRIHETRRLEDENRALKHELARSEAELFWGESAAVRRLLEEARRIAGSEALVVLSGESGTGKGALARQIHRWSPRADAPFVNVNCAGLSRDLLESELFGHEKGAFTGAAGAKPGLFELAHRGTLFLDEVAEIDLPLQARLLKAIEEKRFHRVGGIVERAVDVRIIAASNRDLRAEVAAGRFRQDLFFRVNVLELKLPALRERRPDAPLLARRFLRDFDARAGRHEERVFSPEAEGLLEAYSWPGNVREVRNLAERLSILTAAPVVGAEELTRLLGIPPETARGPLPTLDDREREYVAEVLRFTGGNKSAAAEILGITRNTLYAKIRAFDLVEPGGDPAGSEEP